MNTTYVSNELFARSHLKLSSDMPSGLNESNWLWLSEYRFELNAARHHTRNMLQVPKLDISIQHFICLTMFYTEKYHLLSGLHTLHEEGFFFSKRKTFIYYLFAGFMVFSSHGFSCFSLYIMGYRYIEN